MLNTQRNARAVRPGLVAVGALLIATWLVMTSPASKPQKLEAVIRLASPLQACADPASFECSAAANLTAYKQHLLQSHLGSFREFTRDDWPLFEPVIGCPSERPLTKYGEGDGSKLLCRIEETFNQDSSCIIYSLGSFGDYQFESSMLNITSCQIHTFDCTYDGQSLDNDQRHHYHKWCLGNGTGRYRTWDNITATLGHQQVDLLKMDIEGHEHSVLASFKPEDNLPKEISMEFHVKARKSVGAQSPRTPAELAFVFLHMANLGYASYAKEVNRLAPFCCSEFTFMRVGQGLS